MQALRDAFTLLLVILIVATVRVSPVPEIELSPAHASEPTHEASGIQTEAEAAPGRDADMAEAAGRDQEAPCPRALTAQSAPRKTCGPPQPPCDV